jgi:hypothetical protein
MKISIEEFKLRLHDFVYYIKEGNEIIYEFVFESEQAAIDFAEMKEMKDYEIIEYDVQ